MVPLTGCTCFLYLVFLLPLNYIIHWMAIFQDVTPCSPVAPQKLNLHNALEIGSISCLQVERLWRDSYAVGPLSRVTLIPWPQEPSRVEIFLIHSQSEDKRISMRFEDLSLMTVKITPCWNVTPCNLAERMFQSNQLPWRWRLQVALKHWYMSVTDTHCHIWEACSRHKHCSEKSEILCRFCYQIKQCFRKPVLQLKIMVPGVLLIVPTQMTWASSGI
jgi:hypothetical protein